MPDSLELTSSRASVVVDAAAGGRLSSLIVDGAELLVQRQDDPMAWGSYPMVPFAGRVRHGRFSFAGADVELPTNDHPHAIHGFGFVRPWTIDGHTLRWDFDDPWPFAGRATQHVSLHDDRLDIDLTVTAEQPQPVVLGFHPWFRRHTEAGELTFDVSPGGMYRRDPEGLPDGTIVDPPPGPWDDCFVDLAAAPTLRWGALSVELRSNVDHWVVYDEPDHAVCIEPQTGPPDLFNLGAGAGADAVGGRARPAMVLDAGESMSVTLTIDWS